MRSDTADTGTRPGASGAARGLSRSGLALMQVLIAADELVELLGDQPLPDPLPRGLWVVDTLAAALNVADTVIHQRTPHTVASGRPAAARRHGLDSDEVAASGFDEEHEPVVVLVAFVPRLRNVARLRAILQAGARRGVVGVLIGDWHGRGTVAVRGDGLVWTADRGPAEVWRGDYLHGLDAAAFGSRLAGRRDTTSATDTPPPERRPARTAATQEPVSGAGQVRAVQDQVYVLSGDPAPVELDRSRACHALRHLVMVRIGSANEVQSCRQHARGYLVTPWPSRKVHHCPTGQGRSASP